MFKETISTINQLLPLQKEQMYDLMNRHYDNCNKTTFLKDLSKKNGVLLLCNQENEIVGFSTYKIMKHQLEGKEIEVLFSGDTIMDSSLWGSRSPFRIFGKLLQQLITDDGKERYWFLISKGHRTYLFLPLFFKTFYPCYKTKIPAKYTQLLHQLCIETFNTPLPTGSTVIKANADRLKAEYGELQTHKLKNEHINFFYQQNPDYQNGDELLCIAPLKQTNLTSFGTTCCKANTKPTYDESSSNNK